MKNNKGEITTKQLVTLIILILSFTVILFLIFRLDLGETSDKQICHNSVVLRSQSKLTTGPLDCKTNYLCISGGGECESLTPTTTIEVDPGDEDEIMQAIADEMADCWWMFGEGDINYVGTDLLGYHCAICSSIGFDDEIGVSITYEDLFNYLEITEKDNSQTYLKYLFDIFEAEDFIEQSVYLTNNYNTPFSFNEKYSVITGRNVELGEDRVIPVYFIKTSDLGETPCDEFITKA
jgi:hypothetical protein